MSQFDQEDDEAIIIVQKPLPSQTERIPQKKPPPPHTEYTSNIKTECSEIIQKSVSKDNGGPLKERNAS